MMSFPKRARLLAIVAILSWGPSRAAAGFVGTDLGALPSGPFSSYSLPRGVNASGQVVGVPGSSSGHARASLHTGGRASPGRWRGRRGSGQAHTFLYAGGAMVDLGDLGGSPDSFAVGINVSGQIHVFLFSNGDMTFLGTLPGAASSSAPAINDSGQVVGGSSSGAFHDSNGSLIDLGDIFANAINSWREIAAGYAGDLSILFQYFFTTDLGIYRGYLDFLKPGGSQTGRGAVSQGGQSSASRIKGTPETFLTFLDWVIGILILAALLGACALLDRWRPFGGRS
jgi:hypothetical protein